MDDSLTLRDYQRHALRTDRASGGDLKSIMVPLLGLASESGSLLGEYKKWLREGDRYKPFTDQVSEELGDILWYLAAIADRAGLDLQEIAEENLAKLSDRWPDESQGASLFGGELSRYDGAFPAEEQLPRRLHIEFEEVKTEGTIKLLVTRDGKPFGDPLTDNSHVDDGYRFHDVFHFTNAILLGWSPIVRRLLRVKRKSAPHIDEVEDGARAAIAEEAIAATIFAHAKDYSFFDGAETVEYELLRMIRLMTRPFEVRDKSLREWENAILQGYSVWRPMFENKGGVFVGDAEQQSVHYESL